MHAIAKGKFHLNAEITAFTDLSPENPDHYIIELKAPEIAKSASPGQFIHVLPPSNELMLRRPFSLLTLDKSKGTIAILFRVIGEGTRVLTEMRAGDRLDIIGPLGSGFPMDLSRPAIIAGGGVGIPPLVYLAEKFIEAGFSQDGRNDRLIQVFLGARNRHTMLNVADFRNMGIEPILATEDGSMGTEGFITDAMDASASRIPEGSVVYSCGPIPMLAAISKWSEKRGYRCWASMENKLGCGFGACLGCSIPVFHKSGSIRYERVCTEGPAFDSRRVAFNLI